MGLIWFLAGLTTLVVYPFIMGQIARKVDPHGHLSGWGIFWGLTPVLTVFGVLIGLITAHPAICGTFVIVGALGNTWASIYAAELGEWEIFVIGSFPLALPLLAIWKLGRACLYAPRALYRLGRGEL